MASSVSSERASSSAGITSSKRQKRLKGDVVKVLQFLKCLIRPSLDVNLEDDDDDILAESGNQLGADTEQSTLLDDLWLVEDDDAATER
ncbi:hypothetical protein PILCRDRAFT_13259 [Piloderma croceum F 1598]|uniref:Uncharacterized protein n=1 Tax=Piloderma croceum (strain F 1598) TaxID=765440 RepID=A0A0C3F7P7_PILCF|nr:hypothetical protein PILCRDRAFT_13259 [Piloderma croceum F 1598]